MLYNGIVCGFKLFDIRRLKTCETTESYFVGEIEKQAKVNRGLTFKDSVNFITVAEAKNNKNFAPKLIVSIVTT